MTKKEKKEFIEVTKMQYRSSMGIHLPTAHMCVEPLIRYIGNVYKSQLFRNQSLKNKSLHYTSKREGKNKGQFGYYFNSHLIDLLLFMWEYNLKSIVDLGAGVGHLIMILYEFGFSVGGYEIEKDLILEGIKIHQSHILENCLKEKDILILTKIDLRQFEVIYFWEPFSDERLVKKFVDNLISRMKKNQYIAYRQSGRIGDELIKYVEKGQLKRFPSIGLLDIYQKL